MSEEKKNVKLKEEQLSDVVAGATGDYVTWKWCKYCKSSEGQTYIAYGIGYDSNGKQHSDCRIFSCNRCGNHNYYDYYTGELL